MAEENFYAKKKNQFRKKAENGLRTIFLKADAGCVYKGVGDDALSMRINAPRKAWRWQNESDKRIKLIYFKCAQNSDET